MAQNILNKEVKQAPEKKSGGTGVGMKLQKMAK